MRRGVVEAVRWRVGVTGCGCERAGGMVAPRTESMGSRTECGHEKGEEREKWSEVMRSVVASAWKANGEVVSEWSGRWEAFT